MEVHKDPAEALCDGENSVALKDLSGYLKAFKRIEEALMSILNMGKEVLKKEAEAILHVMEALGDDFDRAIETIGECTGRVVLLGMGKSGLICKKIASTFSSTGTPAIFLHPADSLHGDLGMLQKGDVLLIVSNSGETEEIIKILPWIKRMDIPTIIITGDPLSTIAACGDVVFKVNVDEACPYNVVPTSSTTATLALGDATGYCSYGEEGLQN